MNIICSKLLGLPPRSARTLCGRFVILFAAFLIAAWWPQKHVFGQSRPRRPVANDPHFAGPMPLGSGVGPSWRTVPPKFRQQAPNFYPQPIYYSSRFVPPPAPFESEPGYWRDSELGMFAPPPGGTEPLNQMQTGLLPNDQPIPPQPGGAVQRFGEFVAPSVLPSDFRVVISETFFNRLVQRDEIQPGDVRDHILGAQVTGRQTTRSQLKLDLQSAADQAKAAFVLTGDVQTLTTGVTSQALINTAGQQHFVAVKDVFFDGQQFLTTHALVFVRAHNQTIGAMTPLSGSLFGGLADRIAFRAAERLKPESEAIARDRVAEKVYPAFDGEIDSQLTTANAFLRNDFRKRLQSSGLIPASETVSTTEDRFYYSALVGKTSGLKLNSRVDHQAWGDAELNLSVHESLLNELIGRGDLRGFKTTDKELQQQMVAAAAILDGLKSTLPVDSAGAGRPDPLFSAMKIVTDIEFDVTDPVNVRFDRDCLLATIKAQFKPAGQALLPPLQVRIEYRAVLTGTTMRLEPSRPKVKGIGRADDSSESTVAEVAIENLIALTLPTFELSRVLPARLWQKNGPVPAISGMTARNGWLSINIE